MESILGIETQIDPQASEVEFHLPTLQLLQDLEYADAVYKCDDQNY